MGGFKPATMKFATFTSGSGDAALGAVMVDESAVIDLARAHERLHTKRAPSLESMLNPFLPWGDVVELEIERIVMLRNRFVQ
jgi:hypothetical protein